MKKVIITGANGVGKSDLASRFAARRPNVPIVSFDAIRLVTDWNKKPLSESCAELAVALATDAWILEGGPSVLQHALNKADALVWLDPPEHVRAWRLATRPLKYIGQTRPELPLGNVDWPLQQYRFALQSLWKTGEFRSTIADAFAHSTL